MAKASGGTALSRHALIAIGAILESDPTSDPAVWQALAEAAAGAKLTEPVFQEVRSAMYSVRNRLEDVSATPEMLDAVVTVAKMQFGPPPRMAKAKPVVTPRLKAPKKPTARKKRKGRRTDG